MVKSYQILLDIPEGTKITTGTTLRGMVKYELDKPVAYKTISIALVGKGYCRWYHRIEVNRQPTGETVQYQASENYPVDKVHLLQKDKNDKVPVEAGTYECPFEFNLSEFIPPSFKSDFGEIKYYLVLKFKKFGFFNINKEFNYKIQICPAIPISIPNDPITINLDKALTKLFADRARRINLKATIERGCLSPGQPTNITYLVTNDSDVQPTIKTELIHITTYRDAQYHIKVDEVVVDECTVKTPSVVEHSVANMYSTITVSPDLYTTRHANIITREFKMKFTIRLPLPHLNASTEIPIYIGEKKEVPVPIEVAEEADQGKERGDPPPYWVAMYEDKDM